MCLQQKCAAVIRMASSDLPDNPHQPRSFTFPSLAWPAVRVGEKGREECLDTVAGFLLAAGMHDVMISCYRAK